MRHRMKRCPHCGFCGARRRPRVSGSAGCAPDRIPRTSYLDLPNVNVPEVGWLWDSKARRTREKLAALEAKPKKALGQNFVTDDKVLSRIVRESGIVPGDCVLEIGPGTGNLTRQLIQAGATVLAVEKDHKLAADLQEQVATGRSGEHGSMPTELPPAAVRLLVVPGDIMRFSVDKLVAQLLVLRMEARRGRWLESEPMSSDDVEKRSCDGMYQDGPLPADTKRVKVVANLPYNITTELLRLLLARGDIISDISLLLQHEVALRLTSVQKDAALYRPMTVMAHHYSTPAYVFRVDKQHFYPQPQVDGALATFALRTPAERAKLVAREEEFEKFVRQAFFSKRKLLTNSLPPLWKKEDVETALEQLGWSQLLRPQDMAPVAFATLYNKITALERVSARGRSS